MPTTVNGIGTHYYGRKNLNVRQGTCRHCNRHGQLASYDTRLWGVFVFIPVIPLGRKRIIDECQFCRCHLAANADEYEMNRQLSVSGALERFRSEQTPERGLEAHANLLGFHQHEQAKAFRDELLTQFPENAALCAALGEHLEQVGQFNEATEYFERAFKQQPELPQARVGMAMRRLGASELDEARELLNFLDQPGAGQVYSLLPLDRLAYRYQECAQHEPALEICGRLLSEYPSVGEDRQFRKFVQKSERALGLDESILPERKVSRFGVFNPWNNAFEPAQRWFATGGLVATLVLIGLAINNAYIHDHRTVHVMNAFPVPATVQFDDEPAQQVAGVVKVTLAEGQHHVRIAGPVEQELDIQISSGYFDRWWKSPVWIVNVGGGSALRSCRVTYAVNPQPPHCEWIVGQAFTSLPDVDYAFVDPPDSMRVEGKNPQIVKTVLSVASGAPANISQGIETESPPHAMAYAEAHLTQNPDDELLLASYSNLLEHEGVKSQGERFLKAGLHHRPVSVMWHRTYQHMLSETGREAELLKDYDEALLADPHNGRLMYLRGRIEPDQQKAVKLFEESIKAEPELAWSWYALGNRALSNARWAECLEHVEKARERKMSEPFLQNLVHWARIGTGDTAELEQLYRSKIQENPFEFLRLLNLTDLLVSTNRAEAARQVLAEWELQFLAQPSPEKQQLVTEVRRSVLYQLGDFPALEQSCQQQPPPGPAIRAQLLLATGHPDVAATDEALAKFWEDPWQALGLSLAFDLAGQKDSSQKWRDSACMLLERQSHDNREAARYLRTDVAPAADGPLNISLLPNHKIVLLAILALRFPELRSDFNAAAERLNVSRASPYHLVHRAISAPSR